MRNFVPYSKASKRKRKEQNLKSRNTWTRKPVTRVQENAKAYSRSRFKTESNRLKGEIL